MVQTFPGFYAGMVSAYSYDAGGYPLYIYKNPTSKTWYIIDEYTGASLGGFTNKTLAVEALPALAKKLDAFIIQNPNKYNEYCNRFDVLLKQHFRKVNAE